MNNYEKVVWLRYQQYKYDTCNFVLTYEEFLTCHMMIDLVVERTLGFSTVDLLSSDKE